MDNSLIKRQAAIDALGEKPLAWTEGEYELGLQNQWQSDVDALNGLPSAEKPFKLPEIYVAEGFDTVEDEDGNIGFGVYVPAENKIYVAGDVEDEIRARALLHEVCHWVQDMCGRPFGEDEANEFSDIVYDALPSAQPKPKPECSCEQIKWERDMAIEQLKELGYGLGEKPRTGHWIEIAQYSDGKHKIECSECKGLIFSRGHANSFVVKNEYKFCPHCGVRMVEPQKSEG